MKKQVKLNGAKILLLCTTDNMIAQFLIPHIKDLQSYGAEVDCVCAKTGFWFDELRTKHNLNMIDLPMTRFPISFKNLQAYGKLKKLQKEKQYDLIYCQQPVGGMLGRFVGKKFNLPVVYTVHGFFFFEANNPIKNMIFKFAEKLMARWTDILITMNEEDFLASKKFRCENCYKISGIGYDENKHENSEFNKLEFKKSLGLKDDDKVILSVSEFIKRKNHKTMIKSFSHLAKTRNDIKLVLCGTGKLLQSCIKMVERLKIGNKVMFLGYRNDINKIMQVSDVFYHQSLHEGLTMSIIEAMNCGLPIVASNVRGNLDLVASKGGILTNPYSIDEQVDALDKILNNEEMRKEMGELNSVEVKKYSLTNVRKQLKEIYEENKMI